MQGRREEYAVMRALGAGKLECSRLFFAEYILLAASGSMAGMFTGMISGAVDIRSGLAVWAVFLVCCTFGAAAALCLPVFFIVGHQPL